MSWRSSLTYGDICTRNCFESLLFNVKKSCSRLIRCDLQVSLPTTLVDDFSEKTSYTRALGKIYVGYSKSSEPLYDSNWLFFYAFVL